MRTSTLQSTLAIATLGALFGAPVAFAQVTTDASPTAVSLTTSGYTQNFDSMGTSGATAPAGWGTYSERGSHDTFSPIGNPSGTGVNPSPSGGTGNSTATTTVTADTVSV